MKPKTKERLLNEVVLENRKWAEWMHINPAMLDNLQEYSKEEGEWELVTKTMFIRILTNRVEESHDVYFDKPKLPKWLENIWPKSTVKKTVTATRHILYPTIPVPKSQVIIKDKWQSN